MSPRPLINEIDGPGGHEETRPHHAQHRATELRREQIPCACITERPRADSTGSIGPKHGVDHARRMNPACSIAVSRTCPSALATCQTARGMALICSMRLLHESPGRSDRSCPMLGHYQRVASLATLRILSVRSDIASQSSLMEPDSLDCGPGFRFS